MNYAAMLLIAAVVLGIASIGFRKIKEIQTYNFKIDGLINFIRIIKQDIRTNEKLRNYIIFFRSILSINWTVKNELKNGQNIS